MHLSWILGVGSLFSQLCASERLRKPFARPCFPEDEPNDYLTCSLPEEGSDDCDNETSVSYRLVRLEPSKVLLSFYC